MRAFFARLVDHASYWLGRFLTGRWLRRARGKGPEHWLVASTTAPTPSYGTLVRRQILHRPFILFFFFVLYGFVSFFKDIANWFFK